MSVTTIRTIVCDAPFCGQWDEVVGSVVEEPAAVARKRLAPAGWAVGVSQGTRFRRAPALDYCPKHAHLAKDSEEPKQDSDSA